MNFDLTNPCGNCPFRNDGKGVPLRPGRAEEICDELDRGTFPCHKTTRFDDEGGHVPHENEQHCAGALIMLEHEEAPSQMMRVAERLGLYRRDKLNMEAPVYTERDDFILAQEDNEI